jgi:hypothetical protein
MPDWVSRLTCATSFGARWGGESDVFSTPPPQFAKLNLQILRKGIPTGQKGNSRIETPCPDGQGQGQL